MKENKCKVCGREGGHIKELTANANEISSRLAVDKTEQIKREWLDFLKRQVIDAGVIDIFSNPLKSPIGNKVADWWLQKLSEQRQEVIDDYQTNYEQQHIASAIKVARQSILEEVEKLSKELETIDIRDILKKLK